MADKDNKNPNNPASELYQRLTKLFSGPVVGRRSEFGRRIRKQQLDKYAGMFRSASGQEFKRSHYNPFESMNTNYMANQNRTERYVDSDQMEYCLHGDTRIAVPGGYKTLAELANEYGLDETFIVYSYDHSKGEIVPAIGRQARKTRTDHAWKVVFENGQEIIGTSDHRLMMRDGTYRTISQLKSGDAMMPFYRRDFANGRKDEGDGYRWIYTMHNDHGRKKGWVAEHILIAEWVAGRRLGNNEVVHHRNFVKYDNSPDNLIIMDNDEHLRYHQAILNEQRKEQGWWTNFSKKHSEWMKNNNPAERKDITFEKILYLCDTYGYHQNNICKMLDTDPPTIKRKLKSKGFANFEMFAKTYDPTWKNSGQDNTGDKNPRYDHALDFGTICSAYANGMNSNQLAEKLNTTYIKLVNRIKANGYKNFTDFAENYANHKVQTVEYYGFIDLYDLTVDGYKNFATDSVISHNTPEIASALDIYADEMTTSSQLKRMLNITCPNEEIKAILDSLYNDILNIEFNLFGWARTMCKYGDFFLYLDVDETYGIKNAIGLPPNEIERLEGEDKTNPNYVQFQWNAAGMTFENWQIAHFRILGNDKYYPYGTSVLDPARRIWRQLTLMEDAMMAYRIVRAPARKAFYVDVGNIPPQEVEQYMQRVITAMKRNQVMNPDSGRVDLRYNPMSIEEDYYIPTRGGTKFATIETVGSQDRAHDIDDVKYLRDKLFSALKVPASYLTQGEGNTEDKTTLAQKDVRFARTIQRLQRSVISELEKMGIIHLHTLGFRGEDIISFRLTLNNPSKIAEIQELEHWKQKFSIATAATEGYFSKRWVSENIFGLSEEEFARNQREMFYDSKYQAQLNATGEKAGEAAAASAGVGLGMPSELETPTGFEATPGEMGIPEPGPETPPETGATETGAAEAETPAPGGEKAEEDVLLATPGNRDGRHDAGRLKSMIRMSTPEAISGKTMRGNFPGYGGHDSLSTLGRGIYTEEHSTYNKNKMLEENILRTDFETKKLIENLQKLGTKDES